MTLRPLEQWVCDRCVHVIERPEDGWVEWNYTPLDPDTDVDDVFSNQRIQAVHIVHQDATSPRAFHSENACHLCFPTNHRRSEGRPLEWLCGPDGLTRLIELLSGEPDTNGYQWVEIARRLHVPYYEEARIHWADAVENYFFEDRFEGVEGVHERDYYLQDTLKAVIKRYGPPPPSSAKHR